MSWRHRAACRGMDTNLFFPTRGGDYETPKAICAGCPVKTECRAEALKLEQQCIGHLSGIWGETSERERSQILGKTWRVRHDKKTPDEGEQAMIARVKQHGIAKLLQ